jgi:hypothetical protein
VSGTCAGKRPASILPELVAILHRSTRIDNDTAALR